MTPIKLVAAGGVATLAATGAFALGGGFDGGGGSAAGSSSAAIRPVAQTATAASGDSLADLYDAVQDGVAYVESDAGSSGSGFVLDDDGHIVTNEHVVEGGSRFAVRLGEGGEAIPATLVGADASTDLAVLQVDPGQAGELYPLELAEAGSVDVGEQVIAIGSPFGLQSTLTSGIVSALDRSIQSPNGSTISGAIQTDAAINPGNSGGPLLDGDGRVIGVNAQIASSSGGNTGVGFAISVDTVRDVVPQLLAGGGSATERPPASPYGYEQPSPYGYEQPPSSPYGYEQPPSSPYGSEQPSPYGDGYGSGGVIIVP